MRRAIGMLALVALVGLSAGLAARATGLRLVSVTTGSMAPTVGVGAWVVVSDANSAARGDIIEFRYPSGSAGRAIKRVLAVGGDVVELTDATILVNGGATRLAGEPLAYQRGTVTVPPGHVYLLGDDHAASYDSRGFGPIPVTDIVGRVWTPIPDPTGLVLALGGLAVVVLLAPVAMRRLRR